MLAVFWKLNFFRTDMSGGERWIVYTYKARKRL